MDKLNGSINFQKKKKPDRIVVGWIKQIQCNRM